MPRRARVTRVPEGRRPLRMIASRGPVATFSCVRSRPHASTIVRASLTTPAGVTSVHPQPLPESPDGDGGAKGDKAGGKSGDGVGDAGEEELSGTVEVAVGGVAMGGCVTHRCSFQAVRTMTIDPAGAVA
nr:MAG TPA: hypothetical protein [Caudoviricetes sp.]